MTTMSRVTAFHSIVDFAHFVTVTTPSQYLVFGSQNMEVRPETVTK